MIPRSTFPFRLAPNTFLGSFFIRLLFAFGLSRVADNVANLHLMWQWFANNVASPSGRLGNRRAGVLASRLLSTRWIFLSPTTKS